MKSLPLLLFYLFPVSLASISVQTGEFLDEKLATCLLSSGYTGYSAILWREDCIYNPFGPPAIALATAVGFSRTDVMFEPGWFDSCPSLENQMEAAINKVRSMDLKIKTLWIDTVEVELWRSGNITTNRAALAGLVKKATSMGQDVGILAQKDLFESYFGSDFDLYSHYPLWWEFLNNRADFTDFVPFGGWNSAAVHRYKLGLGPMGPCGIAPDESNYV